MAFDETGEGREALKKPDTTMTPLLETHDSRAGVVVVVPSQRNGIAHQENNFRSHES